MLLREVASAQVEAIDNAAFLAKLFPDDCLPEPLEKTFIAISSGKTPILKLDGQPDHTWLFVNQGITNYEDPKTDEQQVAEFMDDIAKAAFATYKKIYLFTKMTYIVTYDYYARFTLLHRFLFFDMEHHAR